MKRILLTGGGSGGHVYPLLAVVEVLRGLDLGDEKLDLVYLGPKDDYHALFEALDVRCFELYGAKLRRYASLQNLLDVPKFFIALLQAWWRLFLLMPDAVYSKGGPGALPVVLAAWFYHIPVLIHESDMVPGLTNRISSWFAKRIAVSFEEAQKHFSIRKVAWTGHPERKSIRHPGLGRDGAKAQLGFLPAEPLVVVIGGSQGSQRINDVVLGGLPLIAQHAAVLHQTGPNNEEEVKQLAQAGMLGVEGSVAARHPWKVVPYIVEVGTALQAADVVISRAGSGSIFEIAAFGRAAILIPLAESANDHQRLNAITFASAGGGVVIEEANLVPGIVARKVAELITNAQEREAMETASRGFAKEGGADLIAAELLRL